VPAGRRVSEASLYRPAVRKIPQLAEGFRMGAPEWDDQAFPDEKPPHRVKLSPYAMFETEVTQGQFKALIGDALKVREFRRQWPGLKAAPWEEVGVKTVEDNPAIYVSWEDAAAFANALSRKEKREPCYVGKIGAKELTSLECSGYRLPTEAEWEYAARAGTHNRYAGTNAVGEVCDYANVADADAKDKNPGWTVFECSDGHVKWSSVGLKAENGWGLFDMTGNVWEWVGDWYGDGYYTTRPARDPTGPSSGSERVARGGSWWLSPQNARVSNRYWWSPENRYDVLGFRLSRSLL